MEMKEACVEEDLSIKKEGLLLSMKLEMVKVRQENENLKATLGQLINEYRSLQVHYDSIMKLKETHKSLEASKGYDHHQESQKQSNQKSLNMGEDSSGTKQNNREAQKNQQKISEYKENKCSKGHEELILRLDGKYNGSNNEMISENMRNPNSEDGFEETKDKEKETWSPSKTPTKSNGEDRNNQEAAQPTVKRARVSVRARCDTPTMSDGCQWRKYGQKIAKGNPCPRGYYRCTMQIGCPVRKQVQRCAEDPAILITTYEGTHNHPLPAAATAMASTTSAAATMLLSGSTSSGPPFTNPYFNHQLSYTNYIPNPTTNVYASSHTYTSPYPTITLDMTKPTPSSHTASLQTFNPKALNPNVGLFGQSYLPSGSISTSNYRQEQSVLTDTLAKAIAANPNFQSVLASALTSYVGGEEAKCQAPRQNLSLDHGSKWGEHLALGIKHNSDAIVTGVSQDFVTRSGSLFLDSSAPIDKTNYLS